MKTFKQLTVGDKIFVCDEGSMKYDTKEVTKIERDKFFYTYSGEEKRIDKYSVRLSENWNHNKARYLFTVETMAIRYCKAQMMKTLFSKIESVRDALKSVRDFRQEHFELLNHNWTEQQINILERQL